MLARVIRASFTLEDYQEGKMQSILPQMVSSEPWLLARVLAPKQPWLLARVLVAYFSGISIILHAQPILLTYPYNRILPIITH